MKHASVQELVRQLMDSDPELRSEACLGLGERGVPTTGVLLFSNLESDVTEVRQAAATALGRIRGPGALRALERVLSDPDSALVATVRTALATIESEPEGSRPSSRTAPEEIPALIAQLNRPDPLARVAALDRLAMASDPAVGPSIVRALEDPVPRVRAAAARGLAAHPMARAAKLLLELMEDEDPEVRHQTSRALGALRLGEAYPNLTLALGDDFQKVRVAAAESLARIGGERICLELHQAARSWVPGSTAVLEALLALDEDVYEEVDEWLSHPFEGVRGVGVDWVRSQRDRRFKRALEKLRDDPEPWLRDEAAEALREL